MLKQVTDHLQEVLQLFNSQEAIILNNQEYLINLENFKTIVPKPESKTMTFIDGGQAELLSAGNFSLSLIRAAAVTFNGQRKTSQQINEFYLFSKAIYRNQEIFYESKIFSNEPLIDEQDLFISANDPTIKSGIERAPLNKIASVARRIAELTLAEKSFSDFIVMDGTLEKTFLNEGKYLTKLTDKVTALAKTSSLITSSGNLPAIILNKLGPSGAWFYPINEKTALVKLHTSAKHIFRFEGSTQILPNLLNHCQDALFLGYPYGLIVADQLARVTNQEKNLLNLQLMLKSDPKLLEYLNTSNAHEILDRLQH